MAITLNRLKGNADNDERCCEARSSRPYDLAALLYRRLFRTMCDSFVPRMAALAEMWRATSSAVAAIAPH